MLGDSHGNTNRDKSFITFDLSDDEYISRIRWGVCDGVIESFNGCICQFSMETNKGKSIGPVAKDGVKNF